jgi:aminoglycoside/choline kinase family phosphotransferase
LLEAEGGASRAARLVGHGGWQARLDRIAAIHSFLECASWGAASRRFLQGDASVRRYERLVRPDGTGAVLSDMPRKPDGPPVKDGKPYSAIAHLAENVRPVVAVGNTLRGAGFSAPEIYAADLARGLLIVEDLGDNLYGRMIEAGADMELPYATAVEALAALQRARLPGRVPLPDGTEHVLPRYDRGALQIEAELLLDWLWPALTAEPAPADARIAFLAAWHGVFPLLEAEPAQWVLRDYHSPNLFWLPERSGIRRVGIIDCQDAVLGHPAYDLVSLLQDARVEVFEETEQDLLGYYEALRESEGIALDRDGFRAAYAILGAQRATKILGIFARLAKRDAKPQYLRHLPRVSGYLERNLRHPALAELRRWFDRHLPAEERVRIPRVDQ